MPHWDPLGLQVSKFREQHLTIEIVNVAMRDNALQVANLHAPSVEIHVLLQDSPVGLIVAFVHVYVVLVGHVLRRACMLPLRQYSATQRPVWVMQII